MKTLLTFFAQLSGPAVPWSETSKWLFGLLGALGVVWLIFSVVIQARKLFGRVPPMQDELEQRDKRLRGEIQHAKNSTLKEFRLVLEPLIERVEKTEAVAQEIQLDQTRRWTELNNEIHAIATDVAFLRGQQKERERNA